MTTEEKIEHLKRAIAFYGFTENLRGEINGASIREAKRLLNNLENAKTH